MRSVQFSIPKSGWSGVPNQDMALSWSLHVFAGEFVNFSLTKIYLRVKNVPPIGAYTENGL